MNKRNTWFKHYNTASEGSLVGNLLSTKDYEAALTWWVLLEFVSRFEDPNNRGKCTFPLARISNVLNMKPTKTAALLARISAVSQSDLSCDITPLPPRNVTVLVRKWSDLQENRGGKRSAKKSQRSTEVRGKRLEVRGESSEAGKPGTLLFELWNQNCGPMTKASKLSETRKKHSLARWGEHPDPEYWTDVIRKMTQCDFLIGTNNRGWKADFDFFLRPDTHIKVVEGKYSNSKGNTNNTTGLDLNL